MKKSIGKKLITIVLSISMVLCLTVLSPVQTLKAEAAAKTTAAADNTTSIALNAVSLINQQRAAAKLPGLTWNNALAQAAAVRAKECEKLYSHTRPDGTPWWTVNSDLIYGENLASGYVDANQVVQAWMGSKEHRENILRTDYTMVGLSIYKSASGKWYWALEFG